MRKRDIVRHIPGFSRYVKRLETLEGNCRDLEGTCRHLNWYVETLERTISQVVFSDVTSLVETGIKDADEVPLPSAALRFMVVADTDPHRFLQLGKQGAQLVADLMARRGKRLDRMGKLLDLGCGCGRIIRHLSRCGAEELHGCDCNAKAVAWCQRFLDFGKFEVNDLEPPLPYSDEMFGLIYAFSIFTHLPERLQKRWMDEIHRVLSPGGYFLLTVHGRRVIETQGPNERAAFDRGELVVLREGLAGSNHCATFHPGRYVREILAHSFEVVDFIPGGSVACGEQDVYLLRLPE